MLTFITRKERLNQLAGKRLEFPFLFIRSNIIEIKKTFLIFISSVTTMFLNAQTPYEKALFHYRDSIDQAMYDSTTSILTPTDRIKFQRLDYFPPDEKFRVNAVFIPSDKMEYFEMMTTTSRKPVYYIYGKLEFKIDSSTFSLNIYKPKDPLKGYEDWLFCPFTDLTSGEETYGGGRYLDFRIQDMNQPVIDFNYCYNPYCAYNSKYSCPVPPKENFLNIRIEAGVKKFHH